MCYIITLSGWIDCKNVRMSRWIPHYAAAIWLHNKKHHILTHTSCHDFQNQYQRKGWMGGWEGAGGKGKQLLCLLQSCLMHPILYFIYRHYISMGLVENTHMWSSHILIFLVLEVMFMVWCTPLIINFKNTQIPGKVIQKM